MKEKKLGVFIGLVAILVLSFSSNVLVMAQNPKIKIGFLLDTATVEGIGLLGGVNVAQWWINGPGGGIVINGVHYDVEFIIGNEHASDARPDLAAQEAERLITQQGVDLLMGCSMTECGRAVQEVCADYQKIFIHVNCITDDLIDCHTGTCGHCVRCNYDRYKYVFRISTTSTYVGLSAFTYLQWLINERLVRMYGSPVKTAVLMEDLDWTVGPYNWVVYGNALGNNATIVYHARTSITCSDFSSYLDGIKNSGAHLVFVLYAVPNCITLVTQFYEYPGGIPALMAGVVVPAQNQEFWNQTTGGCNYLITLNSAGGTRTPIVTEPAPITTVEFYDKFVELNGFSPYWNSYTTFSAACILKQVLEEAGIQPPFDSAKSSALVPYLEKYEGLTIMGKFKFTGPHPMDPSQYPYQSVNPTMKGTLHETFTNEFGPTWVEGYTRAFILQWSEGIRNVIYPIDRAFSKKTRIPRWMYSLADWDLNFDGVIDIRDISTAGRAFGSTPGNPRWNIEADINQDGVVDIRDISAIGRNFGKSAPVWPLP